METLQENVPAMLQRGVIKPAHIEWSFPFVLIPKPVGSWLLCFDYRWLDTLTIRNTYIILRMDDSVLFLGEATWFSPLDANLGNWQVSTAEGDINNHFFLSVKQLLVSTHAVRPCKRPRNIQSYAGHPTK